MSKQDVLDYIASIPTPDGFERKEGEGYCDASGYGRKTPRYDDSPYDEDTDYEGYVKLTGDFVEVIFNVSIPEQGRWSSNDGSKVAVVGHTGYKSNGKWYTFSRRGVDDSFYHSDSGRDHDGKSAADVLEEQIKRAEDKRNYAADLEEVPGIPFRLHKDERAKVAAKLNSGGTHTFRPAGFGTGMVLSKRKAHRWCTPAPKETAAYFKCRRLYVDRIDCD